MHDDASQLTITSNCDALRQAESVNTLKSWHLAEWKLGLPLGCGIGLEVLVIRWCGEEFRICELRYSPSLESGQFHTDSETAFRAGHVRQFLEVAWDMRGRVSRWQA